jgi:hypothetical protein
MEDQLLANDRLAEKDLITQDLDSTTCNDRESKDIDSIYWKERATKLDERTGKRVPFPLWTSLEKLEPSIGFGAVSFLRFERALCIVFGIMSLVAIASTVFNAHGIYWANGVYVSNYTRDANETEPSYARMLSVQNHIGSIPWSVTILDMSNCFIFAIFVLFVRWKLHQFTPKLYNYSAKASHYTVEVSKLPHDVTESELIEFFSMFGKVHGVHMGLNNGELLSKIEKYNELEQNKIDIETDRSKSSKKKRGGCCCGLIGGYNLHSISLQMQKLYNEIQELSQKEYHCCSIAYITFENRVSALLCRNEYNKDHLLFRKSTIVKRFRDTIKLRVKGAPDSTDIIWKNLQYGSFQRFARHVATLAITYSIIITAIAVAYACALPGILFAKINVPALYAILFVCLVISVTATFIVFMLVPLFANFEKHHRWSRVELFVCIRIFLYQFVSSVAIATVAFLLFRDNDYFVDTYTPLLGMSGEIVIFTFILGFLTPLIIRNVQYYRAKKAISRGEQIDPRRLKKTFEGPIWSIGDRFQNILKPVFVSMFYSALVPFIIPVAFIVITANYWMDKHALLRRFKKPPLYDDKVPYVMITYILPWAVVFHLAVGAGVYYQKDLANTDYPKDSTVYTWVAMVSTLVFFLIIVLLSVARNIVSVCKLATTPYIRNTVRAYASDVDGRPYSEIEGIDSYSNVHVLKYNMFEGTMMENLYFQNDQTDI